MLISMQGDGAAQRSMLSSSASALSGSTHPTALTANYLPRVKANYTRPVSTDWDVPGVEALIVNAAAREPG